MSRPIFLPLAPICLLGASLLGACNLAPDYNRPGLAVNNAWPSGPAYPAGAQASAGVVAATTGWKSIYRDDRLKQLIALAIDNNRDLRVALLNIDKARASFRSERANELPTVNAGASADMAEAAGAVKNQNSTSHQYGVSLATASYEVDLFGRVRNLTEQAFQSYLAQVETQRSTYLTLVSEVATDYLTLAADRERLKVAQDTLKSQQESLELTRKSFVIGGSTELAVAQAQTSVESARGDVALYTSQIAQDINALRLVVGKDIPDQLLQTPPLTEAITAIAAVKADLPSSVLLNRPDILAAEHQLQGANANIGAARAAFFPSITLTSSVGTSAASLDKLFASGTGAWAFAPQISLPIFDFGANEANLASAKADREIYVADYEKAIQTAFSDVANALAVKGTIDERLSAAQALVDASDKAYRLSESRFRAGVDDYLTVLTSQQSLYTNQQSLITTRLAAANNRVTLYQVLGGGTSPDDVTTPAAPPAP